MSSNTAVTVQRLRFVDRSKFPGESLTREHVRIARAGEFQVVVGDHYYENQLCFVIPPGAVVPDKLLEEMWLLGKLAGPGKNRVKEKKIYGVTSEAIVYGAYYQHNGELVDSSSWNPNWCEGQDITLEVGVIVS